MYAISERDAQILLLCYYCVFMTGREHAGPLCACALGVHLFKSSDGSCVCDCVHSNDRLHFLHDCIIII